MGKAMVFCDVKMEHFGMRVDAEEGKEEGGRRRLAVVDGGDLLFRERQGDGGCFM